ncbi:MAG: type I restriction enzyme HsdR N-terminal domain-containing protein [Candidatus Poribacteria bacterium]|nr:type I restriction enzyme HsdR N-terminal domain-containing protein [Candidatus Poribacteria bacterium]
MDFIEELRNLSTNIAKQIENAVQIDRNITEEATKHAFVIPFIKILGYDPYNLTEVVPEFTADIGTKQGEKVDYAIFKDDEVIMLIECKKYGADLSDAHTSQLYRYFSVVNARIAVLTDGVIYRFYTDLEETNIMDSKPFLEFNMFDIQEPLVNELKRFTKPTFDLDAALTAASDLKYTKEIKQIMLEQLEAPSEDFVRFFLSSVYGGKRTQTVVQQFTGIVKRALNQFLNEQINQRLRSAIERGEATEDAIEVEIVDEETEEEPESRIVTTEEELEGFFTVKSILREVVTADRIQHRDTIRYMSVVLDGSIKKIICRLHFNSARKYLGLVNEDGKHERVEIASIDDIYNYADELKATVQRYDTLEQKTETYDHESDVENIK